MTTEEAIQWFEARNKATTMPGARKMTEMAIAALRAQQEAENPEPEKIKKMRGEMVTCYDDSGNPYSVDAEGSEAKHIIDLLAAEAQGRLVVLPFVAMVEQSLQGGEMKPQRDQRFNGRYAVVYSDKKKWASPLIDICGRPYRREQAEERLAELAREEADAALEAQKGGGER